MYRLACKSREIESACRGPSCVYPGICPNLNIDHAPLVRLYRRAREVPGVKKVLIASGVRDDLAVESPEYVRELVQHHVGGYLKIAPEAISEGPLSKMMKPGVGTYHRFKALFDRYSRAAGKEQYLIPYFIAAHPGTTDQDMLELALWLKENGFRANQVQAFLRYHDPHNGPLLREALRRMGRADLIGSAGYQLVPAYQPAGTAAAHEGRRSPAAHRPFRTQHTGLPKVRAARGPKRGGGRDAQPRSMATSLRSVSGPIGPASRTASTVWRSQRPSTTP